MSNNFVLSGRVGRYFADVQDFNVNNQVRFTFADGTTNVGMAGVPANLQHRHLVLTIRSSPLAGYG